ncbi:MAG: ATP-binding protein, partial [Pseudomonadota bacterium]
DGLIVQAAVADRDGVLTHSSLGPVTSRVQISDRDYFKRLKDDASVRLVIAKPVLGRLSGQWSIPIARRIVSADGSFAGIVFISISPAYFSSLYADVDIGPNGVIALIGTDGVVRAEASDTARPAPGIGGSVPGDRPYLRPDAPAAGTFTGVSPVDGVERINAYRRLDDLGLVALVGFDRAHALAAVEARHRGWLPWAAIISVFLVGGGILLARHQLLQRRYRHTLADQAARLEVANQTRERILEGAAEGIYGIDTANNATFVNSAAARMLGRTALGLPGTHALGHRLADGEPCTEATCAIRRTLADGLPRHATGETFADVDGRPFPVEYSVSPQMVDGRVSGAVVVFRDISERMRLQTALEESEARYRRLFDLGGDAIFLHAADDDGFPSGPFLEVNDVACQRLGYSRDELLRMAPSDIDDASTPTCAADLYRRGDAVVFRRVHVAKDGRRIPVEIAARFFELQGTRMCLSAARDITEREALEAELRRSNAELEQFAYMASHDLRAPLRMVSSFLSLLEKRLGDRLDGEEAEFLRFAVDGSHRMERMIKDLLEYSRIGRMGDALQRVDCRAVLDDALSNLGLDLGAGEGPVRVATPLPEVRGHASELTRLFQNLIGNALKFVSPDRPARIEVGCAAHGAEWEFAISDNGIGFSADDRERLFKAFQRLATAQSYEGTGLGLASCRKIVEHHGGRIWAESEGQGRGSTFHFTLPAAN